MPFNKDLYIWICFLLSCVVVGIWGGSCPTLPSGYCFTDCTKEAYYRIVCEGVSSKVLHEDLTVFAGLEANFSLHIWNSPEITRLGGNIFAAVANFILHVELQNLRHLQMLPEVVDMSNLRQLIIRGTPLLKQFPLEALPNSLVVIEVQETGITQFINDKEDFNGLPNLKEFRIKDQIVSYISNFFISFSQLDTVEITRCQVSVSMSTNGPLATQKPLKLLRIKDNSFRTNERTVLAGIFVHILSQISVDEKTVIEVTDNFLLIDRQSINLLTRLKNVKVLDLRGNFFDHFNYITMGSVLENFTNLQTLDVSDTQLQPTSDSIFSGLPSLEILKLSGNDLRTIGNFEIFKGITARNLSIVHMNDNRLKSLLALKHAGINLTELRLSKNVLKVDSFQSIFGWFPKLKLLDLSQNSMETFDARQMVGSMKSLKTLDISCNKFRNITPSFFSGLPESMESLNLTFCDKQESDRPVIGKGTFKTFPPIAKLYLGGGFFKSWIFARLQEMPNRSLEALEELYLPHNKIAYLDGSGVFSGMTGLKHLDLQWNRLQSLCAGCFSSLQKLQSLNLANNALFSVSDNDFFGLPSLLSLDLSGNGIRSFVKGTLDDLTKLQALFLANNRITDVLNLFNTGGKALIHLDLTNLPLPCLNPKLFLQYSNLKWVYFNDSLPLFLDMDADLGALMQIRQTPMHPWVNLQQCQREEKEGLATIATANTYFPIEVSDPSGSVHQVVLANFASCFQRTVRRIQDKTTKLICPDSS